MGGIYSDHRSARLLLIRVVSLAIELYTIGAHHLSMNCRTYAPRRAGYGYLQDGIVEKGPT